MRWKKIDAHPRPYTNTITPCNYILLLFIMAVPQFAYIHGEIWRTGKNDINMITTTID